MTYRAIRTILLLAFAAVPLAAQVSPQSDKAAAVLADARKAIGAKTLQTLNALSVDATLRRNMGERQLDSDLELLVQLPDKYARSETITGGPANATSTTGFNGDTAIQRFNPAPGGGGVVVFRMGGPGTLSTGPGETTPEQKAERNKAAVRGAKADLSRLMLGWFAMTFPSMDATYSYAAEAVSPDGKADVIDVKAADGFAARLFIDQRTHLPLMVTYTAPKPRIISMSSARGPRGDGRGDSASAGGIEKQARAPANQPPEMADYTLYFDDWRDADGVKFPFTIKRAMAGTTTDEWTVRKVKIDPTIDPKAFDVEGS